MSNILRTCIIGIASCRHFRPNKVTILTKKRTTAIEHHILISSGLTPSYPEFIDIINSLVYKKVSNISLGLMDTIHPMESRLELFI